MNNFRKERIGITNAARLLSVSVTELKNALQQDSPIKGHAVPKPLVRNNGQYLWLAGDILDFAEKIQGG